MNATDTSVYPYPVGDSSLRRMGREAAEMGFDSIVAIEAENIPVEGVRVLQGVVIAGQSVKDVLSQMKRVPRSTDLVFVDAGDLVFNRAVIGVPGVNILRHLYKTPKNSFDHVSAKIAAEKDVAIDISLHPLIRYRGSGRQKVITRYADIITLHRRYRFPLTISSHARSVLDQRSVREVTLLCSLFGMNAREVQDALSTAGMLTEPWRPVRVVQ